METHVAAISFGEILEALKPLGQIWKILIAIVIFLVGRSVAKGLKVLVKKGLQKTNLDDKLSKYVGGVGSSIEDVLSNLVYFILVLFVLLFALEFAEITDVSQPIRNMLDDILGFIPRILAAGAILFVGIFLAKIVKQLVENFLSAVRLDERLGNKEGAPITTGVSTAVFSLIILILLPAVMKALAIDTISEPILKIVDTVFNAIPKIILAGVLVGIGFLVAQVIKQLVGNILTAMGANAWPEKLGIANVPADGSKSLSNVVSWVVGTSIMVIIIASALDVLDIGILNTASEDIVDGYFRVLLAVIILGGGILFARFAYNNLADKNETLAKVAKYLIITISAMAALHRSAIIDPELVQMPYQYILAAAAVALAIGGGVAIGLGGKDYVANWLAKRDK